MTHGSTERRNDVFAYVRCHEPKPEAVDSQAGKHLVHAGKSSRTIVGHKVSLIINDRTSRVRWRKADRQEEIHHRADFRATSNKVSKLVRTRNSQWQSVFDRLVATNFEVLRQRVEQDSVNVEKYGLQ